MTIDAIKGAICRFFNGRTEFQGVPFIKSPTNTPAPVGCYIATGCDAVQQDGRTMEPAPGAGLRITENVASLYFVEVEGDGDNLRKVRNFLQHPDFIAAAAAADFTVWEIGDIMRVDTFDGEFLVRQWRLTCTVNFEDTEEVFTPVIASVTGSLNGNSIEAERDEGGSNG